MNHLLSAVVSVFLAVGANGRGAIVPWTTYEAEDMMLRGAAPLGPDWQPHHVASECSQRRCIELSGVGQYVEFVAQAAANALVVRYSLPDSADGRGIQSTLSLSINGAQRQKLFLTSAYSYLYGKYPFTNTPSDGSPRGRFDEVRNFNVTIVPGDTVRLQQDTDDSSPSYVIDFIETELVAPGILQPAGYLNAVTDCGIPIDGKSNVLASLQECLSLSRGGVYVPPGKFLLQGDLSIPVGTKLQGAGMWYTTFVGNPGAYWDPTQRVRILGSSRSMLADFSLYGWLTYRSDVEPNDGIAGQWGEGSTLSRLWVEHTKAGFWVDNSKGLLVDSCRVRNTIADGINLWSAMSNTIVRNAAHRNTGDDSFAMWPWQDGAYTHGGNVFQNCTGQLGWLAQGASLYGGVGNKISGCRFHDYTYGCGVLVSTTFDVTTPFSETTVVDNTDVLRSGGFDQHHWRGAVQVYPDKLDINNVVIANMNIHQSASHGIQVRSPSRKGFTNGIFSNLDIPNSGLADTGVESYSFDAANVWGDLTFSSSNVPTGFNDSPDFRVTWEHPVPIPNPTPAPSGTPVPDSTPVPSSDPSLAPTLAPPPASPTPVPTLSSSGTPSQDPTTALTTTTTYILVSKANQRFAHPAVSLAVFALMAAFQRLW